MVRGLMVNHSAVRRLGRDRSERPLPPVCVGSSRFAAPCMTGRLGLIGPLAAVASTGRFGGLSREGRTAAQSRPCQLA